MEEVALFTAGPGLLIDEVEAAIVESAQPFVPADLREPVAGVAGEVEAQHAQMPVVLGASDRRRYRLPGLGPPADHLMVGGHEAAAGAFGLVGGRGDLLRVLQRVGG